MNGLAVSTDARTTITSLIVSQPSGVFAILDPVDQPEISERLLSLPEQQRMCLWHGKHVKDQWEIAPFLVALDEELWLWIQMRLTGTPWGIVLSTTARMPDLRKHLRRFLMAQLPDGREVYFRYYDPRVIGTYLQACTTEELVTFFGPMQFIVAGSQVFRQLKQ